MLSSTDACRRVSDSSAASDTARTSRALARLKSTAGCTAVKQSQQSAGARPHIERTDRSARRCASSCCKRPSADLWSRAASAACLAAHAGDSVTFSSAIVWAADARSSTGVSGRRFRFVSTDACCAAAGASQVQPLSQTTRRCSAARGADQRSPSHPPRNALQTLAACQHALPAARVVLKVCGLRFRATGGRRDSARSPVAS